MQTTRGILQQSGIAFGTSGARGLVEQFTDEACAAFTVSFLDVMRKNFAFDSIAIGVDRRPSSPQMAAACATAAKQAGYEVHYYGVLPTPALAFQAMQDHIPCIMVTGSHIPFDRNGLKFYRPDGEIDKQDEQAILETNLPFAWEGNAELPPESNRARDTYVTRYLNIFPAGMLKGKRIGLYEHSSAGRDINREVLSALGAEVVSLGRTEQFVPIDTEAVSAEDRERGRNWAQEHQLDAILSTDGDGDRPLFGDEHGEWLRGDLVGLLCARYLGVETLAVPVSCNTAIEACGGFQRVERTRIGSPYVIAAMQTLATGGQTVAGFEANGGFLLGSGLVLNATKLQALPTRDALLPALALLADSYARGVALSALVTDLPQRYTASDRIQNFPSERSRELITQWKQNPAELLSATKLPVQVQDTNTTDGLRLTLTDGRIIHLRPSGNAPELRCYAEAENQQEAETLTQTVLRYIATLC